MSKKKSNSRAKRKQVNNKQTNATANNKNVNESNKNSKKNNTEVTNQAQTEAKLTAYTASAMLTILVSAGAMVVAMIMLAKPAYYVLESLYGTENNEYTIDMLAQLTFEGESNTKLTALFVIMAVLIGISLIMSLITMFRAMDPFKKPSLPLVVTAFVCALAAMIVLFCNWSYATDMCADTEIRVSEAVSKSPMFNVYSGVLIAVIANVVFMIANIIGTVLGLSKWKKDGRAY